MPRLELNELENQLRVGGDFEELHWPRFHAAAGPAAGFWRLAACVAVTAMIVGLLIDGFRWLLLLPVGAAAVCVDAACWLGRRRQGWVRASVTWRAYLPCTSAWLLGMMLPLAAFAASESLWTPWLLLSAAVAVVVFARDLALHFIHYASAHHRLTAQTQEKWRRACRGWRWTMAGVTPARSNLSEADQGRFARAFATFRGQHRNPLVMLGSAAALAFVGFLWPADWGRPETIWLISLALIGLAAASMHRAVRGEASFKFTWLAVRVWCQSPPAVEVEAMAPWSASGPLGRTSQRRWWLGLKAVTLGSLLAPLIGPAAVRWREPRRSEPPNPLSGLATFRAMATQLKQNAGIGGASISATLLLIAVVTFGTLLLGADYAAGATLRAAYDLLEHEDAVEHERREFRGREYRPSLVDGIADRLRNSRSPPLRASTLIGFAHGPDPYCVVLPDEVWPNGIWVLGPARSGKTHLALNVLIAQRIRRNDSPVFIFDFKGDDALFSSAQREAEWAGRKLIHFTNVTYFSSYLFNPLNQESLRRLTITQLCQTLLDALNLSHGFSYGRGHFSAQSRAGLGYALKMKPQGGRYGEKGWIRTRATPEIETFEELSACVRQAVKKHPECSGAHQLVTVVQDMAEILHLNFRGSNEHLPQSAVDAAIQVPKLLVPGEDGRYPVVYFYLRAGSEPVAVSQIAKLFIAALKTARVQMQDDYKLGKIATPPPNALLFMDEWQHVADDALRNMLEQGGGLGIHFVLANQDISQLDRDDKEYLQTVWENCGNKLIFGARDVAFQDLLIKASGEKTLHAATYQVGQGDVQRGDVEVEFALEEVDGKAVGVQMQEQRAPRFDRNTIIEMSNDPRQFLFIAAKGVSVGDYGGYPILVDGEFLFSKADADALANLPWPEQTAETVIPAKLKRTGTVAASPKPNDDQKGFDSVEQPPSKAGRPAGGWLGRKD